MGMPTGIGGGMLRDVLAGRVPVIFREELYATPALVGAFLAAHRSEAGMACSATAGGRRPLIAQATPAATAPPASGTR